MIALGIVMLQCAACLGLGATLLRALGIAPALTPRECIAWSFAMGFGTLGWVMFWLGWAGLFQRPAFFALLALCTVGTVFLRGIGRLVPAPSTLLGWLLIAGFAVVFGFDLVEALAPPADADSLAYHFALPKRFVELGALEFVPRAVDGAIPLLVQMTYVPVLALGGERALTLWTMLTGWAAAGLLFAFLARYLLLGWAAAVTLVFVTTPAVVYGAGTGQVETRIVLFVLVGAAAFADLWRSGEARYAVLSGAMAGFYAASKYTGLLFVAVCGLGVLVRGRRVPQAMLFAAGASIAGFQWYLWNWLHTGDPIFPLLVGAFGIGDVTLWPRDFHAWFQNDFVGSELQVPRSLLWLFAYPFVATFHGVAFFEAGRIGLGPFVALILPFALLALWAKWRAVAAHPLFPLALVVLATYVLWFATGSSQRVRHLLPLYSLLLALIAVAAVRFTEWRRAGGLVAAAAAITIAVQLGGHSVFAANYLRHLAAGESREEFLARNVAAFSAVPWLNRTLQPGERVLVLDRQLVYLIDVPVYYGHRYDDARIDLRPSTPPEQIVKNLQRYGITHVLAWGAGGAEDAPFVAAGPWDRLLLAGCFDMVAQLATRGIASRALQRISEDGTHAIFRVRSICNGWALQ